MAQRSAGHERSPRELMAASCGHGRRTALACPSEARHCRHFQMGVVIGKESGAEAPRARPSSSRRRPSLSEPCPSGSCSGGGTRSSLPPLAGWALWLAIEVCDLWSSSHNVRLDFLV